MLFKHQQQVIADNLVKTGLFFGTGSCKTRTALELAQGKILVIAPKMQVEDKNWQRENKKWNTNKDLTVISKETFRRDHIKLPFYQTVIIDEAHTVLGVTPNTRQRNKIIIPRTSQLFEAVGDYIKRTRPLRFYLVTATPAKSPMAVWGVAKLFGKNWDFYKFRETFYIRLPMAGREVWTSKRDTESKQRLGKAVRGLGYTGKLSDYFDVPPQTFKNIHIALTLEQQKRIKELKTEYPNPIVQIGKIHQVENGVLTGDEFTKPQIFKNEKETQILEYAMEFPQMIIFCKYTLQIERLALALKEYPVFTLTGDTKKRGDLMDKLKTSDSYILIVQSQISSGWELPECPVIIWASMSYSFVDKVQSEGRILRANNLKKNLYISLTVKGGTDEAVYSCLENKQDFHEYIYAQRI